MEDSPCTPVADGGGIIPAPAAGKPLTGSVPDLFNIVALPESIGLELDRGVGGDKKVSASLSLFLSLSLSLSFCLSLGRVTFVAEDSA